MRRYKVGIVGATGMVGQRFVTLLDGHPWFDITVLAASARSAGKTYGQVTQGRWAMPAPLPDAVSQMTVRDAVADFDGIVSDVDFIFCAVDMQKDEIRALEERYAKAECPVVSNNSAHRHTPDVPMLIPEINPEHAGVIEAQRKRLGTRRGFITVKSNCSIQSYVPALHPLMDFGPVRVLACTYQAVSGAGKTLAQWPEMNDNVIPFIGGEEEKSEKEPLKVWGKVQNGVIVPAENPVISAQCFRVPVSDGHMAAVSVAFEKPVSADEILARWREFRGQPQKLGLPSAPKQFLHYFTEDNRPQTNLDRNLENGMAIAVGRLRPDPLFSYKFACLSHNTLRGAAGGAVLSAEYLCSQDYI